MTRQQRLLGSLALLTAGTWLFRELQGERQPGPAREPALQRTQQPRLVRTGSAAPAPAPLHRRSATRTNASGPGEQLGSLDLVSPAILPPEVLLVDLEDLPDDATFAPRQLLVQAQSAEQLVMLAEANDLGVVLGRGGSPTGVLVLPDGADAESLLGALQGTPGVLSVQRNGIIRGADDDDDESVSTASTSPTSATSLQWHLPAAGLGKPPARKGTIAVLDSGMAYRSVKPGWSSDDQAHQQAPSLRNTRIYDPWDYLQNNSYPDDEHGHGTHITSLIASEGAVTGAAAGATILPYRVLDKNNIGLESHLVDALWWAVRMRAGVVNMSLSFGQGYVPSSALMDQLEDAADAGVVLVAAAGNASAMGASWPAASPHVISVGAACGAAGTGWVAPYSNTGSDIDVLAPGGCLDEDQNLDGHPDGLLAETFVPGQPSTMGLYWAQGTSQAAALVSSAAARLRYRGVPADAIRDLLQASGGVVKSDQGLSYTSLNYELAGKSASAGVRSTPDYSVAMLPWISEGSGSLTPRVDLVVVDADLRPVDGVTVRGHFKGSNNSAFSCTTVDGACSAVGRPTADGPDGAGWTVTIGRVGKGHQGRSPASVLLVTEELDATLGALADTIDEVPPIGYSLPDGFQPSAVQSWAFVATGTGVATSPFGLVLTDSLLDDLGATVGELIGGSGISTSPFGVLGIDINGDGLVDLAAVEGSGISTSPFGLTLTGHSDPPSCLGSATCPTSVLDAASGTLVGTVGASSEAAQILGSGQEPMALAGSCDQMGLVSSDTTLRALSDAIERLEL